MDRIEEIKEEITSLLGLEDLYGVEIAFNTSGRGYRDRYLTVKTPYRKEEIWETRTVEEVGRLFNEYYLLNRDNTEELDLEEQLWAN